MEIDLIYRYTDIQVYRYTGIQIYRPEENENNLRKNNKVTSKAVYLKKDPRQ